MRLLIAAALSAIALTTNAQLVGVPGAGGAIDAQTGQFYPDVGGGVINPETGQFHPNVGGGVYHPNAGSTSGGARSKPYQPALPKGTVVIDQATGEKYIDVGNGYVHQSTGRFVPKR